MKKALIFGVSGQDGSLLAKELLNFDYEVIGVTRAAQTNFKHHTYLGISGSLRIISADINSQMIVQDLIEEVCPDEIYHLAAQSSVSESLKHPRITFDSIVPITFAILESIRLINPKIKFYHAASSECFGTNLEMVSSRMPFDPKSPYGLGKSLACNVVDYFRDHHEIFAVNGFLFNHESEFRNTNFVTAKILHGALDISKMKEKKISLGNTKVSRDWGLASEYVEAMRLMLQHERPDDFIISTGFPMSLEEFAITVFQEFNLNFFDHLDAKPSEFRALDIDFSCGYSGQAFDKLGWRPEFTGKSAIRELVIRFLKYQEWKSKSELLS